MNHQESLQLLSEFVDGELDARRSALLRTHLKECASCRTIVAEFRQLKSEIMSAGDIELSYTFASNVLRKAREKEQRSTSWLGVEHSAEGTFIALAVVVLLFAFLTSFQQPSPPISVDQYVVFESNDSMGTQALVKQEEISKQDVFLAVVAK